MPPVTRERSPAVAQANAPGPALATPQAREGLCEGDERTGEPCKKGDDDRNANVHTTREPPTGKHHQPGQQVEPRCVGGPTSPEEGQLPSPIGQEQRRTAKRTQRQANAANHPTRQEPPAHRSHGIHCQQPGTGDARRRWRLDAAAASAIFLPPITFKPRVTSRW